MKIVVSSKRDDSIFVRDPYRNRITGVYQLPVTAHYPFDRLQTVRIHAPQLTVVTARIFYDLPTIVELELRFDRLEVLPPAIFDRQTKLIVLVLFVPLVTTVNDRLFEKTKKLKCLDFCSGIDRLPATILATLRDLERLRIRTATRTQRSFHFLYLLDLRNKLKNLHDLNLRTYPSPKFKLFRHVRRLDLSYSTTFEISFLAKFKFLTYLNLSYNSCALNLKFLEHNRLLKVLILRNNIIETLDRDFFSKFKCLRYVDLTRTILHHLDNTVFGVQCPQLKFLIVAKNFMNRIGTELLFSSYKLRKLDLSGNKLERLSDSVFNCLRSLKKLKLNDNKFTELPRNLFRRLQSLLVLDLSGNEFETMATDWFDSLREYDLRVLMIDRNRLNVIPVRALKTLRYLSYLSLSRNSIEIIETNSFASLEFLQTLDLSRNAIGTVSQKAFDGLENLLTIQLQDNRVSRIEPETFKNLPTLHVIDFVDNPLDQSVIHSLRFEPSRECLKRGLPIINF